MTAGPSTSYDRPSVGMRTEWVVYGRPAAQTLRREISAIKAGDPLAPATVVVPTNHVGVATRRLLASRAVGPVCDRGAGIAAVTFLTVYRLGELLGSGRLAGAGSRPVSTPVIGAALRAALAEDPGVFGPVATHPATETALVDAYRELRDLPPEALDALRRQSRRAADVVRLHLDARRRLERGWYDEEDLLDAAVEVLDGSGAALAELGDLVVYLPERISLHGARLLRAVAGHKEVVLVAATTGDARADAETARSVTRLGGAQPAPPADPRDPMAVVGEDRTRIVTVSDADEEVRAGVRAVVDAVRAGSCLDRIAVLFADPEPYAPLVQEQLGAGGVAFNGTAVMPLTARVAGRTLLGLLALAEGGFRRDEVFAWLAGARILHNGRWAPVTAWERLSREAGVVAGRTDWERLLDRLADELDARAARDEEDPEAPPWRAQSRREEARRARELRDFALRLIDDLGDADRAVRPWTAWVAWARRHLDRLLGGERARSGWPVVEQRAAERLERALDRLGCLGEVEGPVGLEVFARTLELELEADLGRVGRMGEGVLVAPVSMGVGLDLDLVVVLGLAEGVFPAPVRDDSLLPDQERAAAGDALSLRASFVDKRHREFLAALAGSARQVLCVPRGDLRGNAQRVPSRWALDVASALAKETWYSEDLLDPRTVRPWLDHVASFDAGLRSVTFPATDQEYRLRSLMASGTRDGDRPVADRIFSAGASTLRDRRSRRFTRFDGNLEGLTLPSPAERPTSATRLEGWAKCPFAYLVRDILGVQEVENPEEELTISPLDRGSLVHEVLEEFVAGVLARPPDDQPAPGQPWSAEDRATLFAIAERHCDLYEARGLTGRPVFWRRDKRRILADLERILDDDDGYRRANGTQPIAAELAFGMEGAVVAAVPMPIADGRAVSFRGKADRVDLAGDGTIHVVDYKTGSYNGYTKLSEDDPDLGGTKLQLPVYGQAARALLGRPEAEVRADYWFASSKGTFRRIGYRVTPAVLEHFGRTLSTIVAGIEGGVFPPVPKASSSSPYIDCAYCDPDGLGVADLRRSWDRKAGDPALAPFLALDGEDDGDCGA